MQAHPAHHGHSAQAAAYDLPEPAVTSLQALYAQLASYNPSQAAVPRASAQFYSAFDTAQPFQPPESLFTSHQSPTHLSLPAPKEDHRPAYPHFGEHGVVERPAELARPHYTPPDLEQSVQYSKTQGLLDLPAPESLTWSGHCEPGVGQPASAPLPLDFAEGDRLDPGQVSICSHTVCVLTSLTDASSSCRF